MNTKSLITAFAISSLLMATSCGLDDPCGFERSSKAILPRVSSVASTKAENVAGYGKYIATYSLSDDPENPLFVHVFEKDIMDLPSNEVLTKGCEVTAENILAFHMKAYAGDEWYDSEGSSSPNPAGVYFSDVSVTRSDNASSWTTASEKYWLNDVPLTFWSWNEVEPVVDFSEGADCATLTGYTMPSTVTDQKDLLFAYNVEKRTINDEGKITSATGTASTTEKNDVNVHFYHALAEVNINVSGVASEMYVSNVTFNNVYSKGDCDITIDTDGKPVFGWASEDLQTPASFSQDFSATGDFVASGTDKGRMVDGSSKRLFVIPQSLAGEGTRSAVSMSVTFTPAGGGSGQVITRSIDQNGGTAVEWKAGKYYTYKLSKTSLDFPTSSGDLIADPWNQGGGNIGL